jgi:hypothetical protein
MKIERKIHDKISEKEKCKQIQNQKGKNPLF